MAYHNITELFDSNGSTVPKQYFGGDLIYYAYGIWGAAGFIIQISDDGQTGWTTKYASQTADFEWNALNNSVDSGKWLRLILADSDSTTKLTVRTACALAHKGEDAPTIRPFSETTDTLVLADANKQIQSTGAVDNVITVPTNTSVAFSNPTFIGFLNKGVGITTFTAVSTVKLNDVLGGSVTVNNQLSVACLQYLGSDEWAVYGAVGEVVAP